MPAIPGTTAAGSYPLLHSALRSSTIVPLTALTSISLRVRLSILLAAALIAVSGCKHKNDPPGDPPADVSALPGDGVALLSWDALPDLTYWIFYQPGNTVTAAQPGSIAVRNVQEPRAVTGLVNDVLYAFVMNATNGDSAAGRELAGQDGDDARLAGDTWIAGTADRRAATESAMRSPSADPATSRSATQGRSSRATSTTGAPIPSASPPRGSRRW